MQAYSVSPEGKSEFDSVDLRNAKISGRLSMTGSNFKGKLNMHSASVGGNLEMKSIDKLKPQTQFYIVDLREAKISGHLTMVGSKFKSWLDMDSALIERSLFMQKAQITLRATLKSLRVNYNLDVRGAKLIVLDLTNARIKGELRLGLGEGAKKTEWMGSSPKITLRNASVGVLQDSKDAWPDKLELELDGFTYKRFGAGGKEAPDKRGSKWFVNWLGKDKTYSPQPYRRLANVLHDTGLSNMADDILYASRERLRTDPRTSWGRWLLLSGLKVTIGYGLRYFQVLGWVAFLVVLGGVILPIRDERLNKEKLGFWYSLDMLLPVIRLREDHYKVDLKNKWIRRYFYVHKIVGYLLIFFVFAGLADLTQWGQQSPAGNNMLAP